MTGKIIEIIVDAQGQATVQTRGFSGPSCRDASKFVENALGDKTADRLTSEFFQNQSAEQQAKNRG